MKSFLLVAILVVISKADDGVLEKADDGVLQIAGDGVSDSDILSGEASNPYKDVGPCKRVSAITTGNNFKSLDDIANTGIYDYVYSNGKFFCGSAEIRKNSSSSSGYTGSATRKDTAKGNSIKVQYTVELISPGVILETFEGKGFKNTYNLIVVNWDKKLGVFDYIRCSDRGTSAVDSRSIVVKNSANNKPGNNEAKTFSENPKLNGPLKSIHHC